MLPHFRFQKADGNAVPPSGRLVSVLA